MSRLAVVALLALLVACDDGGGNDGWQDTPLRTDLAIEDVDDNSNSGTMSFDVTVSNRGSISSRIETTVEIRLADDTFVGDATVPVLDWGQAVKVTVSGSISSGVYAAVEVTVDPDEEINDDFRNNNNHILTSVAVPAKPTAN